MPPTAGAPRYTSRRHPLPRVSCQPMREPNKREDDRPHALARLFVPTTTPSTLSRPRSHTARLAIEVFHDVPPARTPQNAHHLEQYSTAPTAAPGRHSRFKNSLHKSSRPTPRRQNSCTESPAAPNLTEPGGRSNRSSSPSESCRSSNLHNGHNVIDLEDHPDALRGELERARVHEHRLDHVLRVHVADGALANVDACLREGAGSAPTDGVRPNRCICTGGVRRRAVPQQKKREGASEDGQLTLGKRTLTVDKLEYVLLQV